MAKRAVSGEPTQGTTYLIVPRLTQHERRVVLGP
jgi:hypothetical protein